MIYIARFYHFCEFADYLQWQVPTKALAANHGVRGTTLLAAEGINGTLCCPTRAGLEAVFAHFHADSRFQGLSFKYSEAEFMPFERLKIRVKPEIVTLKKPVKVPAQVGTYVPPAEWNALLTNPNVRVIDTRNQFEVDLGKFKGSEDPHTERFSEFPEYVEQFLAAEKDRPVALYCTGGIRCEKATSYLLQEGFTQVYHLEGGILNYIETMSAEESLWEGQCFVFDDRIVV